MATEVDAELFDSLQDAVDFVAERGGGVVNVGQDYAWTATAIPECVEVRHAPNSITVNVSTDSVQQRTNADVRRWVFNQTLAKPRT